MYLYLVCILRIPCRKLSGSVLAIVFCSNVLSEIPDKKTEVVLLELEGSFMLYIKWQECRDTGSYFQGSSDLIIFQHTDYKSIYGWF